MGWGPSEWFSDGGYAWLLEKSTSDYQQGEKITFFSGNGVLDEWLSLPEGRFHHLETGRSQPYRSALFSVPLGCDGISCTLVGALSADFLQTLESDYSSQGPHLKGNTIGKEMGRR